MPFIIDIKVVPNARKHQFKLDKTGGLVCYLKSPPERGQANRELIKHLAQALKLTQQQVVIVAGQTSRKKHVRIDHDMTKQDLLEALGIDEQLHLLDA